MKKVPQQKDCSSGLEQTKTDNDEVGTESPVPVRWVWAIPPGPSGEQHSVFFFSGHAASGVALAQEPLRAAGVRPEPPRIFLFFSIFCEIGHLTRSI